MTRIAVLGSLRITLAGMIILLLGVGGAYAGVWPGPWGIGVPLLFMALNLFCAILTNPKFHRELPLLVFHMALLALVVMLAASRLSYLDGRVEITEGQWFAQQLDYMEAGPLHRLRLDEVNFRLEDFTVRYVPLDVPEGVEVPPEILAQMPEYLTRIGVGETIATAEMSDAEGRRSQLVFGDHIPLKLAGYRFYTTPNKGFALAFGWSEEGQPTEEGFVHLPAYPGHAYQQAQQWTLPGSGITAWAQLELEERMISEQETSYFRKPSSHFIVLRIGDKRYELRPGERLTLPGGELEYRGLKTWMGLFVKSDWTLPWMLACILIAIMSLAWYYMRKYAD